MFQHVFCSCVLYGLFECELTSYNCLIPLLLINLFSFSLEIAASTYLASKTQLHSVKPCKHPTVSSQHFPCSNKVVHFCLWVTCKWVDRGQNSTGPGKIIQPGRLVTPPQQTSLHQNTFRCSDRVDQDIEVIRSIWLAEPGDWGHSAKWRGNKVSLCVTAPESEALLWKYAANYRQLLLLFNDFFFRI